MIKAAMGIYDDLANQTQPIFKVDVYSSNILVFGGHTTGKTTFLKTLLVRMHENADLSLRQEIYIMDFGGNLGKYEKLPLVSACFDSANEENVRRIFKTLENKIEQNSKILKSERFLDVYGKGGDEQPTHLVLIIDNVNSFLADERYAAYQENLQKFCRDGLSKGLTVVFTAIDTSNGLGRYISNFAQRVAFEVPSELYLDIFGMRVAEPMKNQGRGVALVGGNPEEFQCFLPFGEEKDEFDAFVQEMSAKPFKTEKLKSFGEELTEDNLAEYCKDAKSDEKHILVGLDYYEHKPIEIFLDEARSIAIYGKKKFGKTNLVNRIVRTIRQFHRDYRFVFFDDGRKQLEGIWQEAPAGDNNVYITTVDELTDFLDSNGYAAKMMRGVVNKDFKEQKTPFTVFVLQNKMLFQSVGAQLLKGTFPKMIANAEEKGYIFIYSDVRKISNNDRDTESSLNNTFSVAFLLDNIAEFVGDRGSRSVFGEMDAKELKNEYAHCELGDGYFYDIESDELKKLKFIKNKQ